MFMILVLIMTLLELMIYWTLYSQLFNEKERHSIITCWGLLNNVLHRLTFLPALTSVNLLSFISMKNQECKVRPQIVNVNVDDPVFFPLLLKQVNTVVVVTTSIIHAQNCVFLMF